MARKQLLERFKRRISDLVGLDFGMSAVKAVRMHKSGDIVSLQAADIFSPIQFDTTEEGITAPSPVTLPSKLKSRHACLALPGHAAVVKLLSFPAHFDSKMENSVVENMGLKDPHSYRVGYKVTSDASSRGESRVLVAALPEKEARTALALLASGLPVPHSLEISGLATMTAFLHGPGTRHTSDAVGVVEFGAATSTFALFNCCNLALLRRFDFGTNDLAGRLTEALGVDSDTAAGIITDGSFDISQTVSDVLDPLVKQLVVSRDFVERRENCRVSAIYVSGGIALSRDAVDKVRDAVGVDARTWSPAENLKLASNAFPANFAGQEWRFSAAIGACLSAFEET